MAMEELLDGRISRWVHLYVLISVFIIRSEVGEFCDRASQQLLNYNLHNNDDNLWKLLDLTFLSLHKMLIQIIFNQLKEI